MLVHASRDRGRERPQKLEDAKFRQKPQRAAQVLHRAGIFHSFTFTSTLLVRVGLPWADVMSESLPSRAHRTLEASRPRARPGGTTAFGWPSPQEETPRVITVSYLLVFSVFPLSLFFLLYELVDSVSAHALCTLIVSTHSSARPLCIHIVPTHFSLARSLHCTHLATTHPRSLCAPISWVPHSRLSVYL